MKELDSPTGVVLIYGRVGRAPALCRDDQTRLQLSLLLLLRSALRLEGRSGDGLSRADQLALADKFPEPAIGPSRRRIGGRFF